MKLNSFILIVYATVLFFGCDSETSTTSNTTTDNSTLDTTAGTKVQGINGNLSNWTCVPGQQVGLITSNFTEADIIAAFGEKNVLRNEMGEGESDEAYTATIVFPNTKNQLIIRWETEQPFKAIDYIRIEGDSADWKTSEGITIGTTLDELVRINGKDFKFHGFYEAGEAGMTQSWEGGNVNAALVLYLDPVNVEMVYKGEGLSKEGSYSSANALAKKAGIRVSGMVIKL